jgi:cell division protein FtsW (lipid II flippase)
MALTPDPFILPVLVCIGVLWWLAPNREGAVPVGGSSLVMLALVLAGAALLAPYSIDQAGLQRTDHTSAHAAFFHWVETAFTALGIVLVGLVAALRPRAYRMATWTAGLALAILGAASVIFGGFASALTEPWSWAALVGGLVFIGVGEWEARRLI